MPKRGSHGCYVSLLQNCCHPERGSPTTESRDPLKRRSDATDSSVVPGLWGFCRLRSSSSSEKIDYATLRVAPLRMPKLPTEDFRRLAKRPFGYDEFFDFLKSRRSVRVFKDRPVEPDLACTNRAIEIAGVSGLIRNHSQWVHWVAVLGWHHSRFQHDRRKPTATKALPGSRRYSFRFRSRRERPWRSSMPGRRHLGRKCTEHPPTRLGSHRLGPGQQPTG